MLNTFLKQKMIVSDYFVLKTDFWISKKLFIMYEVKKLRDISAFYILGGAVIACVLSFVLDVIFSVNISNVSKKIENFKNCKSFESFKLSSI